MSTSKATLMAARTLGIKTKGLSDDEVRQAIHADSAAPNELEAKVPDVPVGLAESEGPPLEANIEPGSISPPESDTNVQEIERILTTSEGEELTTREGRTPRSHEDRTVSTRPSDAWIPASIIPSPIQQDGWVFYWVRTSMLGQADDPNVAKKRKEGWEPVRLQDHPELRMEVDSDSRWSKRGNVEMGGLLLCKIPEERIIERRKYHASKNRRQMETVDQNYMQQNDPRMPLFVESYGPRNQFGRD